MSAVSPGNPQSQTSLLWLVLAIVVLVCAALFRGGPRSDRPAKEAGPALNSEQSETGESGVVVSEPGPPESISEANDGDIARHHAKIYAALDTTVNADFEDTPLEEAIAGLGRQLAVPVWFDRMSYQDEGVALDRPVSIHVNRITGRSALGLILEPARLAWVIEDERLKVTTSARAAEKLEVRVYDVTDLITARDPKSAIRFDFNSLMNLITTCAAFDSWQNLSGQGSMSPVTLPDDSRTLSIRQTQAVHEEVRKLLADLRNARRAEGDTGVGPIVVSADESLGARREAAIHRALNKPVQMNVRSRPLEVTVREIARQADVQVVFDRATLTDEGVPMDAPVSLESSGNTVRSALNLVLHPLQLGWLIRNEVLFITTSAKAGEFVEPHVYDMTDIAPRYRTEEGQVVSDLNSIANAIMTTIHPDSDWGNGPGIIMRYRDAGIVALIFPQTQAVHEDVAIFLEQLRELQKARPASTRPEIPLKVPDAASAARRMPRLLMDSRRDAIVYGNNRFAIELYGKLAKRTQGNLLVSPHSVSNAVAQAYAGARGHTAREIDWTMHFNLQQEEVPAGFRTLRASSFLSGPDAQVTPFSQLWSPPGIEFLEPFQKTLDDDYGTKIASVDFSDRVGAAQALNDWAVAQTAGSILRVASPDDFGETNRFVLTNAVRFHGKWSELFHHEKTTLAKFSTVTGDVEVAMMHLETDRARYAVVDGVQVLDKTFGNGDLSMIFLLPADATNGIAELEKSLHESFLWKCMTAEDSKRVEIYLPRFRLESAFHLGQDLETLGMRTAFDPASADFSAASSKPKLALGDVFHKAEIEVDEAGDRAAPGMASAKSQPDTIAENQPVFRANRPFLFLIRDNRTGAILFIGRLVNPGT
jgi:serpin B